MEIFQITEAAATLTSTTTMFLCKSVCKNHWEVGFLYHPKLTSLQTIGFILSTMSSRIHSHIYLQSSRVYTCYN